MTTPIMNVLDIAQQPPFVVGWQELDNFTRAITALYEKQTKEDREAFLIDDCLSLILRHRMYGGTPQAAIQIIERNEQIQESIEEIARLLLSVADSLNTHLPDSFIDQCRHATEESVSRFYMIICEAYTIPAWKKKNNATSGTKGTGKGNSVTANPETPPEAQETQNEGFGNKPKEVLDAEKVIKGLFPNDVEGKQYAKCMRALQGKKKSGLITTLENSFGYYRGQTQKKAICDALEKMGFDVGAYNGLTHYFKS